jgi:hypothetical protein
VVGITPVHFQNTLFTTDGENAPGGDLDARECGDASRPDGAAPPAAIILARWNAFSLTHMHTRVRTLSHTPARLHAHAHARARAHTQSPTR